MTKSCVRGFFIYKIMPKKKPTISKKMRKEFALAFAELSYDVFKDKKQADKVKGDQTSKSGAQR